jgi:hypothetical protein
MRLSFRKVFEHGARITVPLLQRDFAQGRPSASDVRERFLDVLLATLRLTSTLCMAAPTTRAHSAPWTASSA